MLSGQSILCFAPDPWSDIWRNRHQIMSLLAEQNRVLYVEPRPYLRGVVRDTLRGRIPLSRWTGPRHAPVRPGLQVYHPPLYAPISGREPLASLTTAWRQRSLQRTMRQLGMAAPILWLFRPDMSDLPGQFGECLMIYHIVDEYLGYGGLDNDRAASVRRREEQLISRADLVLVTSRVLWQSKGGLNPNTHWVPNAVDYERFVVACREHRDPVPLAGLPRPRIGYVGALNDKIDYDLLVLVAGAFPDVPLVLVGPVRVSDEKACRSVDILRTRRNVIFVGQVPVEEVPQFVAACDVGLLPYLLGSWAQAIHPLKLYEYLACGLAIVSVDIPSVQDEADVIHIALDRQAFVHQVAQALAEGDPGLRVRRQERASHNTWRQRVECISELIEATMQRRDRGTS